jgi:hypothetical protein
MRRRVYVTVCDELLSEVRKVLNPLCTVLSTTFEHAYQTWRLELESSHWPEGPYGQASLVGEVVVSDDRLSRTVTYKLQLPTGGEAR